MLFRILFKVFRSAPPRRAPQRSLPREDDPLPPLNLPPAPPRPKAQTPVSRSATRYPSREERAEKARALCARANASPGTQLKGKCYVIDGDTIVIKHTHIRLAGIDAPELEHAYGKASKWALHKIVKGHVVTATIHCDMSYDRVVATCTLPDGRDIAGELVRQGMALDWPTFSKGKYAHLEPDGVRQKLRYAHARQTGLDTPAGQRSAQRRS